MSAILEAPLRLDIDKKRLLAEFGNFFQSRDEALTELVQNAYRAGATQVDFALDVDTRTLRVVDNGPGAPDPRSFVTAGQSGWGVNVVDPAGLGFFALLGISEWVSVRSIHENGGWEITIDEDAFEGGDIKLTEIERGDQPTGIKIVARLKESVDLSFPTTEFRQFFPINVSFTLQSGGAKDNRSGVVFAPSKGDHDLPTPAGILRRRSWRYGHEHRSLALIWEHRELTCVNGFDLLMQAIMKKPHGAEALEALGDFCHLTLEVDPASGVRPKLPDRREVIDNAAYRQAIEAAADALYNAFNVSAIQEKVASLNLGDIVPGDKVPHEQISVERIVHPIFRQVSNELALRVAGYRRIVYEDLHDVYVHCDNDCLYLNSIQKEMYARNPLAVRDNALADALCREGIPAYADREGEPLWVRIQGRLVPEFNFILADEIEVLDENRNVVVRPARLCLLGTYADIELNGKEFEEECLYAVKATPEEGYKLIESTVELLHYYGLLVDQFRDTLYEYHEDSSGWEVDWFRMRREMIRDYTQHILPERARAEERYGELHALDDLLGNSRYYIRCAVMPKIREIIKHFPEVQEVKTLEKILNKYLNFELNVEAWKPDK